MSTEPHRTRPWSINDARTSFLPIVFGAVLLGWGWWDASGTGDLDDQTTGVVFAVLAAGAVVGGSVAWLVAGRRAVRVRRLEVLALLERHGLLGSADVTAHGDAEPERIVAVPGTSRYHRADCLLARGKDARTVERGSKAVASLTPCEMCRP